MYKEELRRRPKRSKNTKRHMLWPNNFYWAFILGWPCEVRSTRRKTASLASVFVACDFRIFIRRLNFAGPANPHWSCRHFLTGSRSVCAWCVLHWSKTGPNCFSRLKIAIVNYSVTTLAPYISWPRRFSQRFSFHEILWELQHFCVIQSEITRLVWFVFLGSTWKRSSVVQWNTHTEWLSNVMMMIIL